jgi:hypothetical protein
MGVDFEATCSPRLVEIWEEKFWYANNASRQDAILLLKDKVEGTFLVRFVIPSISSNLLHHQSSSYVVLQLHSCFLSQLQLPFS